MRDPMYLITETPQGLALLIADRLIPLPPGRAETILSSTFLHTRASIPQSRIATHITDHSTAESSCPCCKLEGRTLRGMGRKSLTTEDRLRAASHGPSGRVSVRHIPASLSGSQIAAITKRNAWRDNITARRALNIAARPQKSVKRRIEDLI